MEDWLKYLYSFNGVKDSSISNRDPKLFIETLRGLLKNVRGEVRRKVIFILMGNASGATTSFPILEKKRAGKPECIIVLTFGLIGKHKLTEKERR